VRRAIGPGLPRVSSHTHAHAYALVLSLERAELARLEGDAETRVRELREAHRLFLAMGAPIRVEQVERQLAGEKA
jgi:hypothetical protein